LLERVKRKSLLPALRSLSQEHGLDTNVQVMSGILALGLVSWLTTTLDQYLLIGVLGAIITLVTRNINDVLLLVLQTRWPKVRLWTGLSYFIRAVSSITMYATVQLFIKVGFGFVQWPGDILNGLLLGSDFILVVLLALALLNHPALAVAADPDGV